MNRNDDPAFEIKTRLDREVERRFDGTRLAAALEEEGADPRAFTLRRPRRGGGPLARVPVPVQWIGVIAAVVAAVTGVRSLILDLTGRSREAAAPVIVHAEPHRPQTGAFPAPGGERRPSPPPGEEAGGDAPSPSATAGDGPPAPRPAPREAPQAAPAPPAPGPIDSDPTATTALSSPPAPIEAPVAPTPAAKADIEPRVAESRPRNPVGFMGAVAAGAPFASAGPSEAVGGVQVVALSVGGRRLVTEVREIPEIDATVVTVQGLLRETGGPRAREPLARSSSESLAPGRGLGRSAAIPRGGPSQPSPAPAGSAAPDLLDEVADAARREAYYVRALAGEAFGAEPRPDEHGLIGKGLRVVPVRETEIWGGVEQQARLRRLFDLRTVLASHGAWLAPQRDDEGAEARFLAAFGNRLYDLSLRAAPEESDGEHRMTVRWSARVPQRSRLVPSRAIEATLVVASGRTVILAVPDALFTGDPPLAGAPPGAFAFLAVSPRFGTSAPLAPDLLRRLFVRDSPPEPAILVDGPEPRLPEEAREFGATGRVVLRIVVRDDGSVDGVQVLSIPEAPGAEYLVAAASGAVRRWRYLPARDGGQPVNAYVTVTIEF